MITNNRRSSNISLGAQGVVEGAVEQLVGEQSARDSDTGNLGAWSVVASDTDSHIEPQDTGKQELASDQLDVSANIKPTSRPLSSRNVVSIALFLMDVAAIFAILSEVIKIPNVVSIPIASSLLFIVIALLIYALVIYYTGVKIVDNHENANQKIQDNNFYQHEGLKII